MPKNIFFLLLIIFSINYAQSNKTGNVIFIHPDGTALADWNALRIIDVGPDNEINWDKISGIGLYQGHIKNRITSSSNAGATVHAYGVKVNIDAFGMDGDEIPLSRSGKRMSIMQEAMQNKIFTGIINSGSIVEPGTAIFVASEKKRSMSESITKKVIESNADLVFSGGEEWMLPKGTAGKFVDSGKRTDGIKLIETAKKLGYKIVYTKDELNSLSPQEKKVLGVFAAVNTFNDKTEEDQKKDGLKNYSDTSPTLKEMVDYALKFFSNKGQFILVVEEEGTDNFGNKNNANGKLDALKRADDAIGSALEFLKQNPNTLIITAADSEAGGMEIIGAGSLNENQPLPKFDNNGAPIDGIDGSGTLPFISAPDKNGNRFPFGIAWSTGEDVTGSVIARAEGMNSDRMKGKIDNTDIYRIMYLTLFGKWLD